MSNMVFINFNFDIFLILALKKPLHLCGHGTNDFDFGQAGTAACQVGPMNLVLGGSTASKAA